MPANQLGSVMPEDLLQSAFDAYNRQDADALLALVRDDVIWPGDTGLLNGKDELRSFWTAQWMKTRTHDAVTQVEQKTASLFLVTLDQVVRAVDGSFISSGTFRYGFVVEEDRIVQLQTREAEVRAADGRRFFSPVT